MIVIDHQANRVNVSVFGEFTLADYKELGFPMKDKDFFAVLDEMILKFSEGEPICTDGHTSSLGRKLKDYADIDPER